MASDLERLASRLLLSHFARGSLARASATARRLARLSRPFLGWHWDWAERNLRLVYGPDLSVRDLRALQTLAVENYCLSILEGFRAREVPAVIPDASDLGPLMRQRGGAILCAVHLGGWEAALRALAQTGLPLATVFHPPDEPHLARAFARAREGFPMEWIPLSQPLTAARAVKNGKLLVLMIDADLGDARVPVRFLGTTSMRPAGAGRLAALLRVPLVPSLAPRDASGCVVGHIGSPLFPRAGPTRDEGARLTQELHDVYEPWIHEYAEQYQWIHPHWRARPDGRRWTRRDPIESMWREREQPFARLSPRVRALLAAR